MSTTLRPRDGVGGPHRARLACRNNLQGRRESRSVARRIETETETKWNGMERFGSFCPGVAATDLRSSVSAESGDPRRAPPFARALRGLAQPLTDFEKQPPASGCSRRTSGLRRAIKRNIAQCFFDDGAEPYPYKPVDVKDIRQNAVFSV